jgi:hypothetical protein
VESRWNEKSLGREGFLEMKLPIPLIVAPPPRDRSVRVRQLERWIVGYEFIVDMGYGRLGVPKADQPLVPMTFG